MTPAERRAALEIEFERLKERADHLDRLLQGEPDAWVNIVARMPDNVAEVTLEKPVAEARQTALAMASILKTLDGTAVEAPAAPAVDPLNDMLAKKRAEKSS
jgi:hypothetical protein